MSIKTRLCCFLGKNWSCGIVIRTSQIKYGLTRRPTAQQLPTIFPSPQRYFSRMYDKLDNNSSNGLALNVDYEAEDKLLNDPEMMGKFSYWRNSGSEPLQSLTVGDLLKAVAIKYRDRTAVTSIHQNSRLTYKQIHEQAEAFAAGLIALGLQKGDHVGIWAPSNIEWVISFLAIIKAGLVAVNLNPLYECPELQSAVDKTDVKALIIGDTLSSLNYYNMIATIIPQLSSYNNNVQINSDQLPKLKIIIVMNDICNKGAYRWSDVLGMATNYHKTKLQRVQNEIDVHDVCNIQFTSVVEICKGYHHIGSKMLIKKNVVATIDNKPGRIMYLAQTNFSITNIHNIGTTGYLKGACLTHYNIVNNAYFTGKRMMLANKHHVLCLQVPLFHTFGTVMGLLVAIRFGMTVVIPSPKFSPTKSIEAIIKEKCTVLYGTPTMFIDVITILQKMAVTDPTVYSKVSSLEIALTAGALCTPELFKKMKKYLHLKNIYSGYGMTEVSPIACLSKSTDDEFKITSTIGAVLDHVEIKVINDAGHIVPFGVPGECCYRGYNVMKGYYKDPEINSKSFLPGGWLRSGDKFILLENGYGQVVGRIKDTIIRGGENIEPSEIETILATHPDIINVQVFAVSDDRLGETVAASIIKEEKSSLTEDDVRKYCEGKLTSYKTPKYVQFVEDYPRTATGKPMKFRLRENLEQTLNLNRKDKIDT